MSKFVRIEIFSFTFIYIILYLVMAIELLMACQAIDLLHPLKSTPPLQAVHDFVRKSIAYVFSLFT